MALVSWSHESHDEELGAPRCTNVRTSGAGSGSALQLHRTPNPGLGVGSVQVQNVRELDRDQFNANHHTTNPL